MNKLVYIAGPMRGIPGFNYPLFNDVAKALRQTGYQVINPAEIGDYFGNPEDLEKDKRLLDLVMSIELLCVIKCDAICLLQGWETSKGARAELAAALEHNLEVIESPIRVTL
ncbi:MAG: DUF4406 domain-containing protein [Kiritimatiellae bacterium]|nr:DUF4406 domain-containing protein [Kiritimatiellia bacterium]